MSGGYWDESDEGSTPCACGKQCAERDYQGNPARGPRAFCDTDRSYIWRIIRGLPDTYIQLSFRLLPDGQQDERVSGSREEPAAVNLKVETFMREIILVTVSWEEQVRATANLSEIPGGAVRDGAALSRACRILSGARDDDSGFLDTLLSLAPESKRRPLPGSRKLADCEPGSFIFIDQAGDAWQNSERDGTAAGLEFLKLNGRARAMLGLSLQRRRVAVACDGCGTMGTLVQREAIGGGWEPVVRCTNCPETYIGTQFGLLMGREYEATLRAQQKAS